MQFTTQQLADKISGRVRRNILAFNSGHITHDDYRARMQDLHTTFTTVNNLLVANDGAYSNLRDELVTCLKSKLEPSDYDLRPNGIRLPGEFVF